MSIKKKKLWGRRYCVMQFELQLSIFWKLPKKKNKIINQLPRHNRLFFCGFAFYSKVAEVMLTSFHAKFPMILAQQKMPFFFFYIWKQKPSNASSLVASVGVQIAMPALVGIMWELECYKGNFGGTTRTITFEPGTPYCNSPWSGHPNEWLIGLLGTRKRSSSWHVVINQQLQIGRWCEFLLWVLSGFLSDIWAPNHQVKPLCLTCREIPGVSGNCKMTRGLAGS